MMSPGLGRGGPVALAAVASIAVAASIALLMPATFGALLALWVAVSVPIGIAVGHCALNRED